MTDQQAGEGEKGGERHADVFVVWGRCSTLRLLPSTHCQHDSPEVRMGKHQSPLSWSHPDDKSKNVPSLVGGWISHPTQLDEKTALSEHHFCRLSAILNSSRKQYSIPQFRESRNCEVEFKK